jgi:Protein of unknown function (DUF3073)
MGRGRAKAKQTKKARELKYSSPGMDVDALQRELAGLSAPRHEPEDVEYEDEYEDEDYRRR